MPAEWMAEPDSKVNTSKVLSGYGSGILAVSWLACGSLLFVQ